MNRKNFKKFLNFHPGLYPFCNCSRAFVRATNSGAGCGRNWPLCKGNIFPEFSKIETVIEFTHRSTSGLSLVLVLVLGYFAFKLFPKSI